jgi:hypothetical protein
MKSMLWPSWIDSKARKKSATQSRNLLEHDDDRQEHGFQPVKTAGEAASGVGLLFRRAGDSMFGAKRSDAEESRFKT